MSSCEEVFRRIQAAARSVAAKSVANAPTQEYLIRHTLESFLHRLTQTSWCTDCRVRRSSEIGDTDT